MRTSKTTWGFYTPFLMQQIFCKKYLYDIITYIYVHMQILRNFQKQKASGRNRQLFQGNHFFKSVFPSFAFKFLLLNKKVLMPQTKNCVHWKARIQRFPVHNLFDLQLCYCLFNHNNREDKSYIAEPQSTFILHGADY